MTGKIISLVVFGLILSGAGGVFAQAEETTPAKAEATSKTVQEISLTADIAPVRQVQIMSKVSGTLEEIFVELGDKVEKNQIIAKIDSQDIALQMKQAEAALISARVNYRKADSLVKIQAETNFKRAETAFNAAQAQLDMIEATARTEFFTGLQQTQAALKIAQANLAKAEEGARPEEIQRAEAAYQQALANFHNAEKDLQRAEDDYNRGAIPEQILDKTKLGFEVAQAQLASARANLELIRKGVREEDIQMAEAQVQQAEAALELIESRLDDCTIKSPISGIVGGRFADEGSLVGPGQPLISIVDISSVKIILHIGEENLDEMLLTKKIAVTLENYLDQTFTPQKINISPTMDPLSRKIKVEVKIANPDLRIKPGMFARVKLILGEEK